MEPVLNPKPLGKHIPKHESYLQGQSEGTVGCSLASSLPRESHEFRRLTRTSMGHGPVKFGLSGAPKKLGGGYPPQTATESDQGPFVAI